MINLVDIAGILGLIVGLATLVLTRWENRRSLLIDIFVDHGSKFRDELIDCDEDPLLILRFINTGQRAIPLDKESIRYSGDEALAQYPLQLLGLEKLPHPLNPGQSCEVGIFLDAFLGEIKVVERDRGRIRLKAEVSDLQGKRYRSKRRYVLLLDVNEVTID